LITQIFQIYKMNEPHDWKSRYFNLLDDHKKQVYSR